MGDDHRLVHTHTAVTGSERFDEFIARDDGDIGETAEFYSRKEALGRRTLATNGTQEGGMRKEITRKNLSNPRGIPQDAGGLTLTEYLIEVTLIDRHAITSEHVSHQGRALLLTDRWQLRLVANQQHATILTAINERHQIVEQASTAESRFAKAQIRDHRGLIYYK